MTETRVDPPVRSTRTSRLDHTRRITRLHVIVLRRGRVSDVMKESFERNSLQKLAIYIGSSGSFRSFIAYYSSTLRSL